MALRDSLGGLFSGGGRDGVGNMGLLGDSSWRAYTDRLGLTGNYGLGMDGDKVVLAVC